MVELIGFVLKCLSHTKDKTVLDKMSCLLLGMVSKQKTKKMCLRQCLRPFCLWCGRGIRSKIHFVNPNAGYGREDVKPEDELVNVMEFSRLNPS